MGMDEIVGLDEFSSSRRTLSLLRAILAEYFGNLMLNFFGCASVVGARVGVLATIAIPFCFGFVVFVVVQSLGHVSGAHINPAVTFAMMSILEISIIKGLLYIVAQCLGSITGSALLMALTPEFWHGWNIYDLGVTGVAEDVKPIQGFGIELFLGFLLVLTICGIVDPNRPEAKPCGPLAIGISVTLGHLAFMAFTGSSMNPARSLGSAVIANVWKNHWVYWAGPIVGGILAALIYKYALSAKLQSKEDE